MKTLVVGLGKSGRATYEFLEDEGDDVVGFDDSKALMEAFIQEGKNVDFCPRLTQFDRVIVSPGIPPSHPLYAGAVQKGLEVVGEAELALQRLHQPCIAVTGTNGKTTVTLLIEHILKASGLQALALGNVGRPLTAYVKAAQKGEIMVVELSSYQLETLRTPCVDLGLVLNITPDHLDRYGSLREYAMAKCRLQELVKPSGTFWVHQSVAEEFGDLLKPGYQIYGIEPILPSQYTIGGNSNPPFGAKSVLLEQDPNSAQIAYSHSNMSICAECGPAQKSSNLASKASFATTSCGGNHDRANIFAAWCACKAFVDEATFSKALKTFQKPEHRIEFVTSWDGVDYFDDSKGTNIDATIKGVEAMSGKVILIAGGVDKGSSYEPWKKVFAGKVKHILALGQAAKKIAEELSPEFQVEMVSNLHEAVRRASEEAKKGDSVLLSPGCSSYDMFRDYVERGEKFKQFVLELGRET